MHTQESRTESSFSPFRPGLKFESTQPDYNPSDPAAPAANPVDPPDNQGGGGTTTTTPTESGGTSS